jgi:PAS domain S-box-containing protein
LLITAAAFWDLLRNNARRRTAEMTLFTEKERAQVTLASIGDAVISTDTPGNVTFLNEVAEKITGWSGHDAAGRGMDQVYRLQDTRGRAIAPNWAKTVIQQDQTVPLPLDCLLLQRDDSAISIEGCVAPIHNREGQAIGTVIVSRDVSAARAMAAANDPYGRA